MHLVSIRGAITADLNSADSIDEATLLLLKTLVLENDLTEECVVNILFTATSDLTARYPSVAVRDMLGWNNTAMLNFEEKIINGQLPRCIRVLITIETDEPKEAFTHVYLKDASILRPDWIKKD